MKRKTHIITLIVIIVTGIVLIAAAYRFTTDIRSEAEKQLKTEEAIEGVINKQNELNGALKKRLKAEAEERRFNRLLQSNDIDAMEWERYRLQKLRDENAQADGTP